MKVNTSVIQSKTCFSMLFTEITSPMVSFSKFFYHKLKLKDTYINLSGVVNHERALQRVKLLSMNSICRMKKEKCAESSVVEKENEQFAIVYVYYVNGWGFSMKNL